MPTTKGSKDKSKLLKVDMDSSCDSDESEHELFYYTKNKVKLMKQVVRLIKPKKIKAMAPDCIKDLDIVDINSMLLEELLGLSNKRLRYIFNGEDADRETSSSDSEEEKPIDVISLDDISDDDDIEFLMDEQEEKPIDKYKKKPKLPQIKSELSVNIKTEERKKETKHKSNKVEYKKTQNTNTTASEKDKLMSVLELLELQARARAIRSQLAIENEKKFSESAQESSIKVEDESDSDVIIESPKPKEIVIPSDSEDENGKERSLDALKDDAVAGPSSAKQQKIHSTQNKMTVAIEDEVGIVGTTKTDILNKFGKQDKNMKTQKLIAKIQKIKLIRSREKGSSSSSSSSSSKNANENKNSTNLFEKSLERHLESITDKSVLAAESSTVETRNQNEVEVSKTQVKVNDTPVERHETLPEVNETRVENCTNEGNKSAEMKSETLNVSYSDNDEIVINLDEDELDGIV